MATLFLDQAFGSGGLRLDSVGGRPVTNKPDLQTYNAAMSASPALGQAYANQVINPYPSGSTPEKRAGDNNALDASDSRAQQLAKTSRNPAQEAEYQALQEQAPQAPGLDFGAINEALGSLDALEQETRSLLGKGETEAESFRTAAGSRAGKAKQEGLGAVTTREAQTKQAGSEAETTQRRGFSEIAQQFLGRFGRTGFGQGVTGALGESVLQNVGKIRAGVEQTMQQLFQSKQQIESEFNSAVEQANYQAEQIKNNARSTLQQALAQIGGQRGALQSQKADLVNRALENYRQQVIDVNARNTQFQQQIQMQKVQTDESIRLAQSKAANTIEKLASFSFSPGETKVVPLDQFGGAEQASQFAGTQLPGVNFGTAGQYGVFQSPQAKEQDPYQQFLQSQGIGE